MYADDTTQNMMIAQETTEKMIHTHTKQKPAKELKQ